MKLYKSKLLLTASSIASLTISKAIFRRRGDAAEQLSLIVKLSDWSQYFPLRKTTTEILDKWSLFQKDNLL